MAIPDHPWTKATKDAAAVRIAMTVAERGEHEGELRRVTQRGGDFSVMTQKLNWRAARRGSMPI